MRKSVVNGFILLAVIAGFMRQTQVADPVRVALASAQLAFPAQLLPQISVGGAAQPTKVTDHWYSPLRTKDGARLRFGYVQSEQAPAIEAISVEVTGKLLAKLPILTPVQRAKLVNLDFVDIAPEHGTGPFPALDRFCTEVSETNSIFTPSAELGFNLMASGHNGPNSRVWLSLTQPILMSCGNQLPMVNEAWGLACYYFMPVAPDLWVGGRLYDGLTPAQDWEVTLTLLADTLRGLISDANMPEMPQVHIAATMLGVSCTSQ